MVGLKRINAMNGDTFQTEYIQKHASHFVPLKKKKIKLHINCQFECNEYIMCDQTYVQIQRAALRQCQPLNNHIEYPCMTTGDDSCMLS